MSHPFSFRFHYYLKIAKEFNRRKNIFNIVPQEMRDVIKNR